MDYTSLQQLWATLEGSGDDKPTTVQKLATLNAITVAAIVDVTVQQVVGFLLLQGIYPTLQVFAQGSTGTPQSLAAAKTLMAWLTVPNAPVVAMSNPTVYATVQGMGNAVVAQETASPGSTGFTQAVLDGLVALSAATVPWWIANGFSLPVDQNDLVAAGNLT